MQYFNIKIYLIEVGLSNNDEAIQLYFDSMCGEGFFYLIDDNLSRVITTQVERVLIKGNLYILHIITCDDFAFRMYSCHT